MRFYVSVTDDQGTLLDRVWLDVDRDDPKMKEIKIFEDVLDHVKKWGYEDGVS